MLVQAEGMIKEVMTILNTTSLKRRTAEAMEPFDKRSVNIIDMGDDPEVENMTLRDLIRPVCRLVLRAQRLEKYVFGLVSPLSMRSAI